MDLNATFRTVIALLKVLHNTALTDCKRNIFKMSFCSRLRQVNPSFKRSFRIKEREAEKWAVHKWNHHFALSLRFFWGSMLACLVSSWYFSFLNHWQSPGCHDLLHTLKPPKLVSCWKRGSLQISPWKNWNPAVWTSDFVGVLVPTSVPMLHSSFASFTLLYNFTSTSNSLSK